MFNQITILMKKLQLFLTLMMFVVALQATTKTGDYFVTTFDLVDNWYKPAGNWAEYNEKAYTQDAWYFHSTESFRGTASESYGGSPYSFRDRGVFSVTNLSDLEGLAGFGFQLRDWMLGAGVERPLEYSFDGGLTWNRAVVIDKNWFAEYQVYQEFAYLFPGGARNLMAGELVIRISGGDGTNNSRINIGQFSASFAVQVSFDLALIADPEYAGTTAGGGSYMAGDRIWVYASAYEGYQFKHWSMDQEILSTEPSFGFTMPEMNVQLTAVFMEAGFVACAYGQGHWFANPNTKWAYDVLIGGKSYSQEEAWTLFWPPNNKSGQVFVAYASIFLSGVSLHLFNDLKEAMHTIGSYFSEYYPLHPGQQVIAAARYINGWIEANHCDHLEISVFSGMEPFAATKFGIEGSGSLSAQVHPNPFRDEVTITYMAMDRSPVTIELFSLSGHRIGLLYEGELLAFEQQSVTINGNGLNPGTYIYTIRTGKQITAGRLVLIK